MSIEVGGEFMVVSQPKQRNEAGIASSQAENVLLAGLNFSAVALIDMGIEPSKLRQHLESLVRSAESLTGKKLRLCDGATTGNWFQFAAASAKQRNFVRTKRTPNDIMLLSGRVDNVVVQVNLKKPGHYDFENREVAGALRILADAVETAEHRLADIETELPNESFCRCH